MKPDYKSVISLFPLLSVYIIILGLLKVYVYYNNFNIPIKYFINITELTVFIFNDLIFIIPPLLLLYLYTDRTDLPFGHKALATRFLSIFRIRLANKKFIEGVQILVAKLSVLIALIFSTLLFLGAPLYMILYHKTYSMEIAGFTFLGTIILLFFFIAQSRKIIDKFKLDGMILSITLIGLTSFFIMGVLAEIQETENGKFIGTKVFTEDRVYLSTRDNYYIGHTSTYIFLFDKSNNQSIVIPSSQIKKIEFSINTTK